MYTARKLKKDRRKNRRKSKDYVLRLKRRREKAGPLEGSPMGRGIVLQKVGVESKQPNSAIRKCVRVQLIKNGRLVTAFYKVFKVNGVPLDRLVVGEVKKPMR